MQKNLVEIRSTGMHVIGISYDSLSTLKRFSRKNGITFPLLSDHGSKVIDAYGLLNSDAANTLLKPAYRKHYRIQEAI